MTTITPEREAEARAAWEALDGEPHRASSEWVEVWALPLLSAISTEREGRERAEAELQRRNQNVGWQLIYQAMELWRKAFRDDDLAAEGMVVADKGWADPPEGEYWTVRSTISPKAAGVAPYGHVKAYTRDPNVAALLTFISTALPQLCELRPDEKAEAQISALQALIAEKDSEIARLKGRGCDANNGGEHQVIVQGKYKFCHACGETIRASTALNPTEAKTGEPG